MRDTPYKKIRPVFAPHHIQSQSLERTIIEIAYIQLQHLIPDARILDQIWDHVSAGVRWPVDDRCRPIYDPIIEELGSLHIDYLDAQLGDI